jgi:hypothetical protein
MPPGVLDFRGFAGSFRLCCRERLNTLWITTDPVNNIKISTADKAGVTSKANNIIKTKKPATSKLIILRNLNNPNFEDICTLFIPTNLAKLVDSEPAIKFSGL